jgi:ABC-type enterochelin transport system substrate-binding protein
MRQVSADAAVKALRRAKRLAAKAGVELTDWEGEFLGSVEERVKTYGRAFGDPDKGSELAALSDRQALKLKQIIKKAKAAKSSEPQEPSEPG